MASQIIDDPPFELPQIAVIRLITVIVVHIGLNFKDLSEPPFADSIDAELESYILAKIEERKNAKKEKDFAKADAIRDELAAKGIRIKDTREGTVYEIEG